MPDSKSESMKTEPASDEEDVKGNVTSTQIKTEPEDDMKRADTSSSDTTVIKKENGCGGEDAKSNIKIENGSGSSNERTAEENNDPNLESKIVRQVEYYFGDINLPKDKFLQEQIKVDDGWVPLDVMLRFKRLRMLSSKLETIVSCLKSSGSLIEVSEDKSKIRRLPSKPLPDFTPEYVKEQHERTVYCKGFPQSLNDIDVLLEFFAPFGPVENIAMRRYKDKNEGKYIFKGSIYVLFSTKELAEKFLGLESVAYEGKELIRMTRAAHVEEQKRERDERWGKKVKPKKEADAGSQKGKELPKGCILKISPISDKATSRDDIKGALVAHGANVAFIQYDEGDSEAFVRLHSDEDGAAAKFIKGLEDAGKKLEITNEVEMVPLDGEEEEAFLGRTRMAFERNSQKGFSKRGRNKGGRGNFQGRYRGNKRAGSPVADGATPAKQAAASD